MTDVAQIESLNGSPAVARAVLETYGPKGVVNPVLMHQFLMVDINVLRTYDDSERASMRTLEDVSQCTYVDPDTGERCQFIGNARQMGCHVVKHGQVNLARRVVLTNQCPCCQEWFADRITAVNHVGKIKTKKKLLCPKAGKNV